MLLETKKNCEASHAAFLAKAAVAGGMVDASQPKAAVAGGMVDASQPADEAGLINMSLWR